MSDRLSSLESLPADVQTPSYERDRHKPGIVHLGVGAFFKSHLAVYTDTALAQFGGDWMIVGISLRSPDAGTLLNRQNGLFTVLERDGAHTQARVVGSLSKVICAPDEKQEAMAVLTDPVTRIVSLTVTEKAYGIDRASGRINLNEQLICNDLENPHAPKTVVGYLVEALRQRRDSGVDPFTVLCCDNLPENGAYLRCGVLDFTAKIDPELSAWIGKTTSFPSTMVDRITPASTHDTAALAKNILGITDDAAVETEPFSQWVIEDDFPNGRPNWEAGGAIFVSNVTPYENMKLRMLNGAHSMIAYAGHFVEHKYVRDVMKNADLYKRVSAHLNAAAQTLEPLSGIDFGVYANTLIDRFCNPAIAHETYQIAMDGTQKLPQRLLDPAADALKAGQDVTSFAFAVACWMRYCLGKTSSGRAYDLRDPREEEILEALQKIEHSPENIIHALQTLPGLFPRELQESDIWKKAVTAELKNLL